MSKKVLIIEPIHEVFLTSLEKLGYEYTIVKNISKDDALRVISSYTGLVTSNKLYVDKDLIDAGVNLKWIGRMGSGMEIIDVAYASSKGIKCISSPEGNGNAVAEQALGMLLSLLHNIKRSHNELEKGIWLRDENRGTELEGLKVGIIGLGTNGTMFAHKLHALNCKVYYYDPYISSSSNMDYIQCKELKDLQEQVDVVSFHVPINDETRNYFDATFLENCKKPIYLINLSRGKVVDLNAVQSGLNSGKIIGAAIDVWPEEPIVESENFIDLFNHLIKHENFIGTAHIGGYSHQATYKMSCILAQKIAKI
jgi:D-3-phosphoglycerate dehydrogenase